MRSIEKRKIWNNAHNTFEREKREKKRKILFEEKKSRKILFETKKSRKILFERKNGRKIIFEKEKKKAGVPATTVGKVASVFHPHPGFDISCLRRTNVLTCENKTNQSLLNVQSDWERERKLDGSHCGGYELA